MSLMGRQLSATLSNWLSGAILEAPVM